MPPFVTKGMRIRARWFADARPVALPGVMFKLQATERDVVGVVKHVRGDHPTNPTITRFYVTPDGECAAPRTRPPGCTCAEEHVEVNPDHVIGVDDAA